MSSQQRNLEATVTIDILKELRGWERAFTGLLDL